MNAAPKDHTPNTPPGRVPAIGDLMRESNTLGKGRTVAVVNHEAQTVRLDDGAEFYWKELEFV